MRKANLWAAACVGLVWSATSSAVPVYYTCDYFGDCRSYEKGHDATFSFRMDGVDGQPTDMNGSGVLVTQQDQGAHTNPSDRRVGHYQRNYFPARLVGMSVALDPDLSLPKERTSFPAFLGPGGSRPLSGDHFSQLVRTSILDAPISHPSSLIADIGLSHNMVCLGTCAQNLHQVGASPINNVPEPATMGLLLLGTGLAFGVKRRRAAAESARA